MSIKVSTGLRNAMLTDNPFRTVMNGGFMKIYAGTPPASADDTLGTATLLCTLSNNGGATGLTFEAAAVNGVIGKAAAEVWKGVNSAGGTATFYRLVLAGDTGAASTTDKRVQGSVAVAGGDINLSSVGLVQGADQKLDFYNLTLPTY